jgi:hypothetical protein
MMVRVIGPEPGIAPPAGNDRGGVIEIANAQGPISPDNVFWSWNSTGDYYVSSDFSGSGHDARRRFNWRQNITWESWEFRFTASGSEYYDWNTDQKWPNRAPFEVWHYSEDDSQPDRRDYFFIIDDDGSGGWSTGDRIYIAEDEYPTEPLPQNAADAGYAWDDDFHLGRVIFNEGVPAEGTIVRFNSTIPNSESDAYMFEIDETAQCGDINGDGVINVADVSYFICYIFDDCPAPYPIDIADVNCDGIINIADVVYLINYIFNEGPPPCDPDGDGLRDC